MKELFLFFILFLCISCNYGVQFTVINNAEQTIDSIKLSNGFNTISEIDSLKKGSKTDLFLDFKNNNPKTDGSFYIKYFIKDKEKMIPFGYYTNGIPLNDKIDIIIERDTVLIKSDEKLPLYKSGSFFIKNHLSGAIVFFPRGVSSPGVVF